MNKTTMQDYRDYIESVYSAALVVGACAWLPDSVVGAEPHGRYTCTNRDPARLIDMLSMDQIAVVYPERGIVLLTQNEQLGVEVESGTGWIGECDACGRWYIESRSMSMRVGSYCGREDERCPDDDYQDEYDPDL